VLAVGACVDPFGNLPDGVQIDGIVAGPEVDCGTTSCTRVIDCATMEEFRTETPTGVAATQLPGADPDSRRHGDHQRRRYPDRGLRHAGRQPTGCHGDGGPVSTVVFELKDGPAATQVAETDRCR
jgi:hypothetical protein